MAGMKNKILVLGLSADGTSLPPEYERAVMTADLLVGGTRHLNRFPDFRGKKLPVQRDIEGILTAIADARKAGKSVVVLATGDPLWFGIGTTLILRFGRDTVTVYPAVASPQVALARLGLSMDKAIVLSRHKESEASLELLRYFPVGVVLTNGKDGPSRIAGYIMKTIPGSGDWPGSVCQCLGTSEERIDTGSLAGFAGNHYRTPNLVVIQNPAPLDPTAATADFGRPDGAFAHEKGLITHPEVRAVVLSKLRLARARVMWDAGAGSGAVGIEAAYLNPALTVHAIEKDPERVRQIAANRETYGVNHLLLHAGNMAEILPSLPPPDRVFIGGGGRDLPDFLPSLYKALVPGGIMVATTITLESFEIFSRFLQSHSLDTEVLQLQVTRMTPLAVYHKMTPDNPITLFTFRKEEEL